MFQFLTIITKLTFILIPSVMKQWWNDISDVYFRKPLKEELQLIDAAHLLKLLNFMDCDDKRIPPDDCQILGSKPHPDNEVPILPPNPPPNP